MRAFRKIATALLLLAVLLILTAGSSVAGTHSTETYPVSGIDTVDVGRDMEAKKNANGWPGYGLVTPHLNLNMHRPGNIVTMSVPLPDGTYAGYAWIQYCTWGADINTSTTLPSWEPPPTDGDYLEEWNRFLGALRNHEDHHVEKWKSTEGRIRGLKAQIEALRGSGTGADGPAAEDAAAKDLQDQINKLVNKVLDQAHKMNALIDQRTNGGAKEGANLNGEGPFYTYNNLMDWIKRAIANSQVSLINTNTGGFMQVAGEAEVSVPPLATLEEAATFGLMTCEASWPDATENLQFLSPVYFIETDAVTLLKPVAITLTYDESYSAAWTGLDIYYYDEAAESWMPTGAMHDPSVSSLTVEVSHLSAFAIMRDSLPGIPMADIDGPYSGVEGSPVVFDAGLSSDLDGDVLKYRWDIDGDGIWDTDWSYEPGVFKTWKDDWMGTAYVEVTDGLRTAVSSAAVSISNLPPSIEPIPDQVINEGDTAFFTTIINDPGSDQVDLTIDAGDPVPDSFFDVWPGVFSYQRVYPDDGIYTVTMTAVDDAGDTTVITTTVTVLDVPPTIEPIPPMTANEGDTVTIAPAIFDPGSDPFEGQVAWGDGVVSFFDIGDVEISHAYADDGTYPVTITVTDDGVVATCETTVTVQDVAPTIEPISPMMVNEGETVTITPVITDPGDDHLDLDIDWGDGSTVVSFFDIGDVDISCDHVYGDDGVYPVTVTVTDDAGVVSTCTTTVTVQNVAPTVDVGPDQTALCGTQMTVVTQYFDPGSDPFEGQVNWGDGTPVESFFDVVSPMPTDHVYVESGTYTVTVTVSDGDGGEGSDTMMVTVIGNTPSGEGTEVSPTEDIKMVFNKVTMAGDTTAEALSIPPLAPREYYYFSTVFDIVTTAEYEGVSIMTWQYDDTGLAGCEDSLRMFHWIDGKWYDITQSVDPIKNEVHGYWNMLSPFALCMPVSNAPVLGNIMAPLDPIPLTGNIVDVSVPFTDPDSGDTHDAIIDWGDGSLETQASVTSPVTDSHSYSVPGVYEIKVTVTDQTTASATTTFSYVVIYDPDGGFVTGGGWIDSPEGAYVADASLTGKATFGFVSKYKKGTSIPEGNTQFQFKVANLNFNSTEYEWLVVAGNKVKFKGTGTINGEGSYGFMLTAVDGSPDSFRIKIWREPSKEVIYDNKAGVSDTDYAATVLGGGSIVVHK